LEQQVLQIIDSEDLVKLQALAELCSHEFFDDRSLSVVTWRRILEVSELANADLKSLEVLDACTCLGKACNNSVVEDYPDVKQYCKRAKEGYEEMIEHAAKMFEICLEGYQTMLGENDPSTLGTKNNLGACNYDLGNYEKALEFWNFGGIREGEGAGADSWSPGPGM